MESNEVRIVDINMSFGAMVGFMFKWFFASIPAIIGIAAVLWLIAMLMIGIATGVGISIKGIN